MQARKKPLRITVVKGDKHKLVCIGLAGNHYFSTELLSKT